MAELAFDLDNHDITHPMQIRSCSFRPLTRSSVSPHRHDYAEWHYVLDGQCGFLVDGERREIQSGDLFVIEPGQIHGVHIGAPDEWLLQYIVSTDPDSEVLSAWRAREAASGTRHLHQSRHALFARLQSEVASQDRWQQRAASHRFSTLICHLLSDQDGHEDRHPAVDHALGLMRERLRTRLDLDEIAATVGLNKAYLSRLFSRQIGSAPMACYTNLKMQLAAAYLLADERPVNDIAELVGFQDPFHFSRVFRRWSGLPPSRWRRQQQKH